MIRTILTVLILSIVALAARDALRGASYVVAPATRWLSSATATYPNRLTTPGSVFPGVLAQDVCRYGYSRRVRNVPIAVKRRVYQEYGISYVRGTYEVDHLVPLELGGDNSLRNLWPESYRGAWNARVKDRIESRLHELVCNGAVLLPDAQRMIASDWINAYRQYLGPIPTESRYYPQYNRNAWER